MDFYSVFLFKGQFTFKGVLFCFFSLFFVFENTTIANRFGIFIEFFVGFYKNVLLFYCLTIHSLFLNTLFKCVHTIFIKCWLVQPVQYIDWMIYKQNYLLINKLKKKKNNKELFIQHLIIVKKTKACRRKGSVLIIRNGTEQNIIIPFNYLLLISGWTNIIIDALLVF